MRILLVVLLLIVSACTSGATSPDTSATATGEVVVDRVDTEAATFRVVRLVDDLEHAWAVAWLPDDRMLVTEREGRMLLVDLTNDEAAVSTLDGLPAVSAGGQGGLLDVAPHPEYARTGWIYFTYVAAEGRRRGTVLARAKLDGASLVDIEELYRQVPFVTGGRHFGSRIVFPGDGTLLFSIGDRGKRQPAQDRASSIGSVLRLTLDGAVPSDNPFVNVNGVRPEIYSYGHRNIQGMAVHPQTGEVWSHEHGPRGGDELNRIAAGLDYGWPSITYGREYLTNSSIGGTEAPGMEQPTIHWTPSIAPSGLAVYTGDRFPEWKGQLFVGALSYQKVQRVVLDGARVTHQEALLENELGRIRDVRTSPDGFLYVLTDASGGGLYRLEPVE